MVGLFKVGDWVRIKQGVSDNINGAMGTRAGFTGTVDRVSAIDAHVIFDQIGKSWFVLNEHLELDIPAFKAEVEEKPDSWKPNMLVGNKEDWELRNQGDSVMLYFKGKLVGQFCFMGTAGFNFFDRTAGNRMVVVNYDDKNLC